MSATPSATPSASPMGVGPILGILLTVVVTIVLITTFTLFTLQRLRENRAQQAKQSDPETSLVAAPPYSSHRFGSSETVVDDKRAGDFGYAGGGGGKGLDEKRVMDRVLPALTRPTAAFQPSKYDTDFSAEKARRPAYLNAFVNASQADLQATDPFADHTNTLRNKESNDELRVSTAQTLRISAAGITCRSPSPYAYDGRRSEEQPYTYYSGSVADSDADVPPMLPPLTLRTESSWNPFEHETPYMSSHY